MVAANTWNVKLHLAYLKSAAAGEPATAPSSLGKNRTLLKTKPYLNLRDVKNA